jgi:hypothetical protein
VPRHARRAARIGIAGLGHVVAQVLEPDVEMRTVETGDGCALPTVHDLGDHGSERQHTRRQHLGAEQGIHERRLPPLELAYHHDVEAALGETLPDPLRANRQTGILAACHRTEISGTVPKGPELAHRPPSRAACRHE